MIAFEYDVVSYPGKISTQSLTENLNKKSFEGWRVISVCFVEQDYNYKTSYTVSFERIKKTVLKDKSIGKVKV